MLNFILSPEGINNAWYNQDLPSRNIAETRKTLNTQAKQWRTVVSSHKAVNRGNHQKQSRLQPGKQRNTQLLESTAQAEGNDKRVYLILHRFYPYTTDHKIVHKEKKHKHKYDKHKQTWQKQIIAGHRIVQSCHRRRRDRSESWNPPLKSRNQRQNGKAERKMGLPRKKK